MKLGERSGFRGVWPVVQRELRESSRRSFNHWLRVASALAGMSLLWLNLAILGQGAPEATVGATLFSSLHTLLLALIFCIVPSMTADCIAREKREGTLGLLFLTGLTPAGIVIGKSLVQAFRAFTLWVAVLPIMTIPFLTGGVSWGTAATAVTMQFCTAVLCLAAGLLASTLVKTRAIAFALGLGFAVLFLGLFSVFAPFYFTAGISLAQSLFFPGQQGIYFGNTFVQTPGYWGMGQSSSTFIIRRGWTLVPASALSHSLILAGCVAAVLLIFMIVIRIAARRVDHSWKDKLPSPARAHLVRRYCTPLFQDWFSRRMRQALDRNPIAWLQQYSWKARLSKWGLCLVFVLLECGMANGSLEALRELQAFLTLVLFAVFTFVGVNSFLEEKKTGALELILISPLSVNQIIRGRVWGLWKQFLAAVLVIECCYIIVAGGVSGSSNLLYRFSDVSQEEIYVRVWWGAAAYLALPFFATYFALRVKNLIVGAMLTLVALWLAPGMGVEFFEELSWHFNFRESAALICAGATLGYAAFAAVVCFLLRHSLSRRIYSF